MKGFILVTYAITLIAILRSCNGDVSCEIDIHTTCPGGNLYESVAQRDYHFWKEESFFSHCSDVLNDIDCKQQYLDTCGNATYNVEFILLTSGLKRLMTELCNNTSELREDYRQQRPCLENSTKDFESCFLRAAIAAARLKSQDDANGTSESSDNGAIVTLCRFQGIFRSCLVNVADENCGKGTAKFLDRLLSLVLEDLYKAKCAHF
ncbi:uncharacterized protein TNIN_461611 [Trichonephila inaurata madagascariensis]|uniref:Uncharacterized protein n=1 Tax=Trichonephila inaurata madagascariensis TaxID=2747483 RepID=A0A8X7BXG2_9ARAC|nr:uncharacterized protein TNIN_461611 [Trichonephila inaurata madagascariensis]